MMDISTIFVEKIDISTSWG